MTELWSFHCGCAFRDDSSTWVAAGSSDLLWVSTVVGVFVLCGREVGFVVGEVDGPVLEVGDRLR